MSQTDSKYVLLSKANKKEESAMKQRLYRFFVIFPVVLCLLFCGCVLPDDGGCRIVMRFSGAVVAVPVSMFRQQWRY